MTRPQTVFVYCSPAGTTRHVARAMMRECETRGAEVTEVDLGRRPDLDAVLTRLGPDAGATCLFVGSPVYVNHALPPVMDFLARLPADTGIPAIPFVTWGAVSSGMALFEMGTALAARGLLLAGGAKVVAAHSMMWRSAEPLGEGRPDTADDSLVTGLAGRVLDGLGRGDLVPLDPEALTHLPAAARAELAKATLRDVAGHLPPRVLDEDICTECGECAAFCPTAAITMAPYPEFGETCIYCYSCVRDCPEGAIRCDLTGLSDRIRQRSFEVDEQPLTEIFGLAKA